MTQFLIRYLVKNNEDINNPNVRKQYGTLAGITGIICNLFLFAIKLHQKAELFMDITRILVTRKTTSI